MKTRLLVYWFLIVISIVPIVSIGNTQITGTEYLEVSSDQVIPGQVLTIRAKNLTPYHPYTLVFSYGPVYNFTSDSSEYTHHHILDLVDNFSSNFHFRIFLKNGNKSIILASQTITIQEEDSLLRADLLLNLMIPIFITAFILSFIAAIFRKMTRYSPLSILTASEKPPKTNPKPKEPIPSKKLPALDKPAKINSSKMSTKSVQCPHCNFELQLTEDFCIDCGKPIEKCGVCRLGVYARDEIESCPACQHIFHSNHLREWKKIRGFCPICKEKFRNGDTNGKSRRN